jgi:hypothetical protein
MSDRHQLTERIITRVKAIAIYTEGDSVEELTIEHFLLAFRSLEGEEEVYETLQVVFEDAEQICWPNGIKAFTQKEIEEIELMEKSVDSKTKLGNVTATEDPQIDDAVDAELESNVDSEAEEKKSDEETVFDFLEDPTPAEPVDEDELGGFLDQFDAE